MSSMLLLPICK